jgi:hypothetical protein
MEQVKWNIIGKWGKTHLQAEDDSNFLFGKAMCGVVFQHTTPKREVDAGNLVNCAKCLVKIGWAKVIKRNKINNIKNNFRVGELGYSETHYVLLKPLNANLETSKDYENTFETGTIFWTSTNNKI